VLLNASRICEDVSSRKRREVGNANMLLCEFQLQIENVLVLW